jgi:hypothetical protein
MSLACLTMSFIPSYDSTSFLTKYKIAGILVLICRILQNASAAGKLNGSAIYLLEHFPKNSGLMSGVIWSATIAGMCLAALAEAWCILKPERWRLAMRVGSIAGFFGFITIIYLQESREFLNSKKTDKSTKSKNGFFGKLSVFCMGSSIGGMFYYLSSYMPIHFQKICNGNLGRIRPSLLIVYALSALLGGLLNDKPDCRNKKIRITLAYLLLMSIVALIGLERNTRLLSEQILTLAMVGLAIFTKAHSIQNGLKILGILRSIIMICSMDPIQAMVCIIPLISFVCHRAPLYAIVSLTLLSFPVMKYITYNQTILPNFILMILAGIFVGPSHKLMHNMFPPNERYTSISLFYGMGTSIMGGASTYLCLRLSKINPLYPAFYMVFVSSLGLLGLIAGYIHSNSGGNGYIQNGKV